MNCTEVGNRLFKRLDDELSPAEAELLDRHLDDCDSCARQFRLLMLPRRLGEAIPTPAVSPYFYRKLRARIESEEQSINVWQAITGLSRRALPIMAAITLALLSVFAFYQLRGPEVDFYQAFDNIFMPTDRPQRMVIADQEDITNESVFRAITEQTSLQYLNAAPEVEQMGGR